MKLTYYQSPFTGSDIYFFEKGKQMGSRLFLGAGVISNGVRRTILSAGIWKRALMDVTTRDNICYGKRVNRDFVRKLVGSKLMKAMRNPENFA